MNPRLAQSIEIIEFVCTHFADSTIGLVPWAKEDGEGAWVAEHLETAAEHLDAAAAELKRAREER